MEPDDFVGCIISIRTQPLPMNGPSKNIVGTIRSIDPKRQSITLDDVQVNGKMVEDGYVLNSSIIEDISVCGKADFGEESLQQEPEPVFSSTPKRPLQTSNVSQSNVTPQSESQSNILDDHFQMLGLKNSKPAVVPLGKKVTPDLHKKSSAFVKTEKPDSNENPFYAINLACGGTMGKGPVPTTPSSAELCKEQTPTKSSDARVVYTASELEKTYFDTVRKSASPTKNLNSTILESIVAQFSCSMLMSKETVCTPQKQPATVKPKPLLSQCQDQNLDPANLNITVESPLYKLLTPQLRTQQSKDVEKESTKSPARGNSSTKNTSNDRSVNSRAQAQKRSQPVPAHLQQGNNFGGRGLSQKQSNPTSAFEMTNAEIQSEDFNFEENLAKFEKLPVNIPPKKTTAAPVVNQNGPKFGKADTTYYAERHVSSIKLLCEKPDKVFVTDTGIVVPAVSLPVRSKILNLAHNYGLTHGRMVEIMGRAVTQITIPMLGDSYRLSPEREEDRPKVLIFAGPHWNGAVGVAAARILATQGIQTNVFVWNVEVPLFTTELQLYRLTKQTVTTDMNALKGIKFDLVIGAMSDHREGVLNIKPFLKCMIGKPIVLVDPPLLPSYRKVFLEPASASHNHHETNRLAIVTPTLPLAYPTDTLVKLHLVNLGIPSDIFEENEVMYKSPFGDKLILQLFATKQDISAANS